MFGGEGEIRATGDALPKIRSSVITSVHSACHTSYFSYSLRQNDTQSFCLAPSLTVNTVLTELKSPPTKQKRHPKVSFLLANDYNFDTNALFVVMGKSDFRGRYASHSPNKSGFKTLSIVAYPTILAPSWILIFLPTHRQCG